MTAASSPPPVCMDCGRWSEYPDGHHPSCASRPAAPSEPPAADSPTPGSFQRLTELDPDFASRIVANEETECWEWTGSRHGEGYGQVRRERRGWRAHRWAWTLFNGPIGEGLIMCHRCDNPPCCNPDHLFPGTYADNYADMQAKGRADTRNQFRAGNSFTTHCPEGHAYEGHNLFIEQGRRRCRECYNRRRRESPRVTCPDCGQPYRRDSLNRHRSRKHQSSSTSQESAA